jgi:transcriptional regulator NrdR family protein
MRCPMCGETKLKVTDGRRRMKSSGEEYFKRRRECQRCHHRFTTYEVFETPDVEASFRIAEIDHIIHSTE